MVAGSAGEAAAARASGVDAADVASYFHPATPGGSRGLSEQPRVRLDVPGVLWTLVRTDFKVRYHGTFGGFLWALLKPLTMFVVLLSVFSFIFASDPDYRLNLIVGLFVWDFFAEGTKVGLLSLYAKGYLLAKTRFPRWILVLTSSSNALITLLVFALAVTAFLALSGRAPGLASLLLFLAYLFQLFLQVLGISLATSVLFLRYRDLNQVWEVITHAGFFLAPIVYPLDILPERVHFYLYLWLPTPFIQFCRSVLVGGIAPSGTAHLLLAAVTAVVLGTGILIFRRYSPQAAEHL
jgi:ABC-type polysaccharide/polyol phosphate export permease